MENLLGLLRVRVKRGINLAVRDVRTSDPYVVIKMSKQKLKTRVIRNDVNPEWNEDLTLSVSDPNHPILLTVYDHDTFSMDDKMGDADFDIRPFIEAEKMRLEGLPNGTIITKVQPSRSNCLSGRELRGMERWEGSARDVPSSEKRGVWRSGNRTPVDQCPRL